MSNDVKITECPRDAMQGLTEFIPTQTKIDYLNQLLKVGYYALDFGSFVSPKAIPQLRDTAEVCASLDLSESNTKLLSIIGNMNGAKRSLDFKQIHFLGYPHSVSDTFLFRNINSDQADSIERINEIQQFCDSSGKELVVYVSMAFGNPYGEPWNTGLVADSVKKLVDKGVKYISLSDTIGEAQPDDISKLFSDLLPQFPQIEFGAHFHTTDFNWYDNVKAAYEAGCRKFDSALLGFGGCPMAKNDLTGNLPTENLLSYCAEKSIDTGLNEQFLSEALVSARRIFNA